MATLPGISRNTSAGYKTWWARSHNKGTKGNHSKGCSPTRTNIMNHISPTLTENRTIADRLAIHTDLTRRLLVEFLRNETRKFGFNRVVLGLSGGIDCALSATLAVEAFGPENVVALMWPYKTSS